MSASLSLTGRIKGTKQVRHEFRIWFVLKLLATLTIVACNLAPYAARKDSIRFTFSAGSHQMGYDGRRPQQKRF